MRVSISAIRGHVNRLLRRFRRDIPESPPQPAPYPLLVRLAELFDKNTSPPGVLYLGDSVVQRISKHDEDRRTLGEILSEITADELEVAHLSYRAYSQEMFYLLLEAMKRMRHQPRLVILPVNLRSFSPQWGFHPEWKYEREKEALTRYIHSANRPIEFIVPYEPTDTDFEVYDQTPVSCGFSPFTCIGHFRLVIAAKPQTRTQYEFRRQQIYAFHYCYELASNHPGLQALGNSIRGILESGMRLLVYLTPINVRGAERYLGEQFSTFVESNIRALRNALASQGLSTGYRLLDLHSLLNPEAFFHPDETTEHLNQSGRIALAERIKREIVVEMSPTSRS